jgi:hypothetical protein
VAITDAGRTRPAGRVATTPEELALFAPSLAADDRVVLEVISDGARFPSARHLVGYLGLNPRGRQSGGEPAQRGRLTKEGLAAARRVFVEAAWMAARSPAPLVSMDTQHCRSMNSESCR